MLCETLETMLIHCLEASKDINGSEGSWSITPYLNKAYPSAPPLPQELLAFSITLEELYDGITTIQS